MTIKLIKEHIAKLNILSFIIPCSYVFLSTAIAYGDGVHNFKTAFFSLLVSTFIFLLLALLVSICEELNCKLRTKALTVKRELIKAFFVIAASCIIAPSLYYLQSGELHSIAIISGIIPGLYYISILTLFKLKNLEKTSHFENQTDNNLELKEYHQTQFVFCIITAPLIPILIYYLINDHLPILFTAAINLLSVRIIQPTLTTPNAKTYADALSFTWALLGLHLIIFSIGWII